MSFAFNSRFQIGKYTFRGGVNDVKINKSVFVVVDTAHIKLSALSKVIGGGLEANLPQSSVETATLFREGDPVKIELGYNGKLKTEFEGFIRRVNFSTPVVLELEGYAWQLRNKNISKEWKNTTVRQVLEEVIKGTDIVLNKSIPNIKLTNFYIDNSSGLEVLDYLKSTLLLTVYFNGKELYAGIEQGLLKGDVKYRLGWNVLKDDQLKYRLADDTKVLVRVQQKQKKGKPVVYETGDKGGAVHTMTLPNVSQEDLKAIGEQALKARKYTGYEGKITGFLVPYCEPGYKAIIEDTRYGERSGAYFTTSTEVHFGMRGARRIVEISTRLDG